MPRAKKSEKKPSKWKIIRALDKLEHFAGKYAKLLDFGAETAFRVGHATRDYRRATTPAQMRAAVRDHDFTRGVRRVATAFDIDLPDVMRSASERLQAGIHAATGGSIPMVMRGVARFNMGMRRLFGGPQPMIILNDKNMTPLSIVELVDGEAQRIERDVLEESAMGDTIASPEADDGMEDSIVLAAPVRTPVQGLSNTVARPVPGRLNIFEPHTGGELGLFTAKPNETPVVASLARERLRERGYHPYKAADKTAPKRKPYAPPLRLIRPVVSSSRPMPDFMKERMGYIPPGAGRVRRFEAAAQAGKAYRRKKLSQKRDVRATDFIAKKRKRFWRKYFY